MSNTLVTLYLISWRVFIFREYPTMEECLAAEGKINEETFYAEFRTVCLPR